eukprot:Em0015g548a
MYPKEKLSRYFLEVCAQNPHSTAVITGTHRLSYQQLQKAALQVQSILQTVGVKQSEVVAICIPRSAALVAAVLGCVLHGAVFLLVDPSLPAQRMQVQFDISRPRVLLYSMQDHLKIEPTLRACIVPVHGIGVQMEEDHITFPHSFLCSQKEVENFTCGNDVFYIIFTSGSTGIPKAVCASASGTLNRFEWMWNEFPFQCNDVVCFKTSVNFVDCIWEVLGAVLKGACLAIPLEEEAKDPRLLVTFMKKWKVTRVTFVPSYLRHALEFTAASEGLQFLTQCISSGEPLSLSLAAMFLKAAPSCRLLNLYGTSEICGDITYFEVTSQYLEKTSSSFVPIGKPIPNVAIKIIDPNTDEIIPQSSSKPGELLTYGICVAHSYLNSDDKSLAHTSERSIFNTHDLVHYNSSGDLMFIGRRDHQVKIRGVRVNPSEIEAVLEKNSIIERALVVADESHTSLIGFIQTSENNNFIREPTAAVQLETTVFFINPPLGEAISIELMKFLPQYLVPSLYVFTHKLPTLPSGKISRKDLPPLSEIRKLLSASVNDTKPLSKTEEQLCCIIKSILLLDNVPITGNFFALGGNSLSAIELASGIEETLHSSIPVSTIISSPTIQSLAIAIDSEVSKRFMTAACSDDNLDASINDATGPLTFGQETILVSEAIANCDIYEIGVAAKCLQLINTSHLWKSIHNLAMNHESLRTLFSFTLYGKPFQKILNADSAECLSAIQLACSVVDCSRECPLRFINGQISLPELHFNLTEGPLWKFTLFTNVIIPEERLLVAIYALNGLQDIVAMIPNASRNPENMKISGLFDNCLSLRTVFDSTVNLHLLLQAVKEAFVIALMTATAKLNGEFSFLPSLTKIVEIVEGCANDTSIVVMDIRDQEHLLKSFPQANQSSVRFVSVQSLQSAISTHGATLSQRATFGNTMEVCNNERNVKSRWLSDVKICSCLVTEHFSAVCRAAVLTSPQYSMLPLAVGLLLRGVSVDVFTIEYLDSFIQSVCKSGADLLVIPEITVSLILPKIVEHKLSIKGLWIQGLPLGLAYISNWMAASQHMQVIVTHSLMHERHLITHHLNLKDIPSIEDGSIPCIPIGRMCQGLNGKVLHRDGREVYQGFVGNFATVNDSQVYRSTSLVRQLPKDGLFELVSVNAEAYYKGIDVTPALFILSTIPEVSWCGVSQGPPMFSCHNNDEDVDKIVRFVSKAFGIDSETARQTPDFFAVGAMCPANILTLTVDLNTEFNGDYVVSDVYQAVKDGRLIDLVRSRRQN